MKKTLAGTIAAALVLTALVGPSTAAKKKKPKPRKIATVYTGAYDTPAPGVAGIVWQANCGAPNTGCLTVPVGAKVTNLDLEITDATGSDVYAEVWGGDTAGTYSEVVGQVCGSTTKPLKISPNSTYAVVLTAAPDPTVCPALATQGSITATAWYRGRR
jgi:hypothetical protein